ncbi:hypothetical protein Bbelb_265820 [Branchiostoma belcheri]|nr:hypothetical protein Bbelb_265820 [Branchiostoma belcheri]
MAKDESTNNFLVTLIHGSEKDVWFGLSTQTAMDWTWSDGTKQTDSSFQAWAQGEPNEINRDINCARLSVLAADTGTNVWKDMACDNEYFFICQKDAGGFAIRAQSYAKGDPDFWNQETYIISNGQINSLGCVY